MSGRSQQAYHARSWQEKSAKSGGRAKQEEVDTSPMSKWIGGVEVVEMSGSISPMVSVDEQDGGGGGELEEVARAT